MKCTIPEISWHNKDPVLSIDIQPNNKNTFYRLASGGTDSHVLIWYMTIIEETGAINLDLAADLTRHQRAVNAVKWSPNGKLLASADDESVIMLWKLKEESEPINILDSTNDQDKETWIIYKILRGHLEDVYDLSWSPNSDFIVSGSVDNTAMLWEVQKGRSIGILSDHKGFVQGVAWDPKNQYIATLSTDRYLRIFDIQSKKIVSRTCKSTLPVPVSHEIHGKIIRLYHDDMLQSFFRRLTFSPDGNLLITPCGTTDYDGVNKPIHLTYIYSRYSFKQPAIILPSNDHYTVAVKFSPVFYKLRPHSEENQPVIPLPYRMIFAIATKSSVYLYDTQQKVPFALISNIHYTRLTDMTWSDDGRILIVSSTDGFCSLITFAENEIGETYNNEKDITNPVKTEETNRVMQAVYDSTTAIKNEPKTLKNKIATPIAIKRKEPFDCPIDVNKSSSIENKAPTPIAFRRKPKENLPTQDILIPTTAGEKKTISQSDNKLNSAITSIPTSNKLETKPLYSTLDIENAPKPIEIRRTPRSTSITTIHNPSSQSDDSSKVQLPIAVTDNIIMDKNIISSDEKFESPEKKSRPATPISIRRHPRSKPANSVQNEAPQNSGQELILNKTDGCKELVTEASKETYFTPKSLKIIQKSESKSKPRALIISQNEKAGLVEEAMDAWPVPIETESSNQITMVAENPKIEETITDMNVTEDFRLVYEDSHDESITEKINDLNSVRKTTEEIGLKTPRRVPFKTISTPKSKKIEE